MGLWLARVAKIVKVIFGRLCIVRVGGYGGATLHTVAYNGKLYLLQGTHAHHSKPNPRIPAILFHISILAKMHSRSQSGKFVQVVMSCRGRCAYRINAPRSARGWGTDRPGVGPGRRLVVYYFFSYFVLFYTNNFRTAINALLSFYANYT